MRLKAIFMIVLAVLCGIVMTVNGETIKQLRQKQRQAKRNIEMTNRLLNENKKTQKSTVGNLTLIKKQIEERKKLIGALEDEVGVLDANLVSVSRERDSLEVVLNDLKNEYDKSVYYYYFHRTNQDALMYILSSESISQGIRRMRYVQEYANHRKEQVEKIKQTAAKLEQKKSDISSMKIEKTKTLTSREAERTKLENTERGKEKMLKSLASKEKELKAKLADEQRKVNALNKRIEDMIAAEIAAAERREKAKKEAAARRKAQNKSKTTGKDIAATKSKTDDSAAKPQTKGATIVSDGFEGQRGRLTWPVSGVVTGHYGLHPHPVLDHVQVNNKGIYIQTSPQTDACSVYEGVVTQVFAIPGNNNAIIVKHGDYRTVYANLTTTYVKPGQTVKAKQKLGRVFVDRDNEEKTELYFMLYKGTVLQNPEVWLR